MSVLGNGIYRQFKPIIWIFQNANIDELNEFSRSFATFFYRLFDTINPWELLS